MKPNLSEPFLLGLTLAAGLAAILGWVYSERIGNAGVIIDEPQFAANAESSGARIVAVLATEKVVLATDGSRLFRAIKADPTWRPVTTPGLTTWLGRFAQVSAGARRLYFFPTRSDFVSVIDEPGTGHTHALSPKEAREWNRPRTFGLYASGADGSDWEPVNRDYDFEDALAVADGTLYAIASLHEGAERKIRAILSRDGGRSWEDITHNAERTGVGRISGLLPDPDHPNLVCLRCEGMRGYILQAEDSLFNWTPSRESSWQSKHETSSDFFGTHFYGSGIENFYDYLLDATFGNYFRFPFGSRTSIEAFELAVDRTQYEFQKEGPKEVTATIRFRRGDHASALQDLIGAVDFWGLRIEDGTGRRSLLLPSVVTATMGGPEVYERVRRDYDRRQELVKREVIAGRSYRRKVDLSKLITFERPGVYQVQLSYACPFWAGEGRARWTGGFSGPVMTVRIH
jgi:hypothetical protein